ncbi:hypothetical protein TrRE_jg11392 [Triparma retinervis]|uniref:Uncharacterized protein n=1 Tax=Triparma retinervis TaxID=2557542 RepID=A0A9W7CDR8_9STRA|nr:hypothetical protein TrRE_jg11392 [Triparma retinervis]
MARGIAWPVDPKSGKASSTKIGKSVWCEVLNALGTDEAKKLAGAINKERGWRANYTSYIVKLVELQAAASPEVCLASCKAGLDKLNSTMTWVSGDGTVTGAATDAMSSQLQKGTFSTTEQKGTGSAEKDFVLQAPTGHSKPVLSKADLAAQGEAWANYGCIEPSAARAIAGVANAKDCTELVKDKVFVLLGATSALGPFKALSRLGATIACVARPGKKLNKLVEDAKSTPATLLLPTKGDVLGADLLSDTPEIAEWVISLSKKYPGKQLVVGCYIYLDGERHVRASVGMDLAVDAILKACPNTAITQLVSPATAHAISDEAKADSLARYENTPLWHAPFRAGFGSFAKNARETMSTGVSVTDGLSNMQGPNYALAKTSQQWRAFVAKAEGFVASANHAPAARTESMVAYSTIAAALEGMQSFEPLVAYDPQTASDMMAAILLWDLSDKSSAANPKNKDAHPFNLLVENACHGGMWRCAYTTDSIGKWSFIYGKMTSSYTPEGSLSK